MLNGGHLQKDCLQVAKDFKGQIMNCHVLCDTVGNLKC